MGAVELVILCACPAVLISLGASDLSYGGNFLDLVSRI